MRRVGRCSAILAIALLLLILFGTPAAAGRGRQGTRASRAARPRPVVVHSARTVRYSPALSQDGPLGAYGPLGRIGPVGNRSWNPSRWMRAIGEWSGLSRSLTRAGGPLSRRGPLGPDGPLGRSYGDFPAPLRAGGPLAVVGPDGPLGALGPLGPLGPVGAHGFAVDQNGRYLQGGKPRRTIRVPYEGGARTYELFEVYPADHAAAMRDNDSSFMAVGSIASRGDRGRRAYTFPFRARRDQHVTVVVTPEARFDQFSIQILDHRDRVLATSDARDRVNFIQLKVPAGTRLKARVELTSSGHFLADHPFRLSVVGTSEHLAMTPDGRGAAPASPR